MRPLAEALAGAGYSVSLPRLPGHGTSVEDMMTTTWADWSAAALEAYDALATRSSRVAVLGLSMGGALTTHVVARRASVAQVYINPLLIPPPAEMLEGLSALLDSGLESLESIGSDIKKEGSKEASYNATPLACVKSLFENMPSVEADLAAVTAPSILFLSRGPRRHLRQRRRPRRQGRRTGRALLARRELPRGHPRQRRPLH
jgi:carboxylesterase